MNTFDLRYLADSELASALRDLMRRDHALTAELLAHLVEVDRRRLYLEQAASSLFAYCVDVLKMSEDVAYKRIQAAQAARAYPRIFELVAEGELHLSAICLLARHLTPENHRELLEAARGKSKRAV